MPRKETITCDSCGVDLTTTSNCVDYRLALLNQFIPLAPGSVTAMRAEPILERDYYFCTLNCLLQWSKGWLS